MPHPERTLSTPSAAIHPPPRDIKRLLSALWVFAMFNYLYADVVGLMDSTLLAQFLRGQVGSLSITGEFLFAAAVLMEIPIAMTLLSRVLPYRANRWANIVAGTIKTAVVAGTLSIGHPTGYYLFFALIEIACTTLIVVLAWRWAPRPE
ncbi:DUF6326 family protein [Sorangium sp. So ce1153]|uniref:DUF6326 family protein n=1 Tax=Sorangium sp. So ce1153 TaxID=3133333 RepID=UPI003F5EAE3E